LERCFAKCGTVFLVAVSGSAIASSISFSVKTLSPANFFNQRFLSCTIRSLVFPITSEEGRLGMMLSAVISASERWSGFFEKYNSDAAFTPSRFPP
jgi:hypothetical protein